MDDSEFVYADEIELPLELSSDGGGGLSERSTGILAIQTSVIQSYTGTNPFCWTKAPTYEQNSRRHN